jgi:hypothetical protein
MLNHGNDDLFREREILGGEICRVFVVTDLETAGFLSGTGVFEYIAESHNHFLMYTVC